jgi:hypothetical protein
MTTRKIVLFLQNAWSPVYAGGRWPRASWLDALERSRSGQRLRVLAHACPSVVIWFDNTTPIVGPSPRSIVPADLDHMRAVIDAQQPDAIVTAGDLAYLALASINPTARRLAIPHPARRVLTNALYAEAGRLIESGWSGNRALVQRRGYFDNVDVTERIA